MPPGPEPPGAAESPASVTSTAAARPPPPSTAYTPLPLERSQGSGAMDAAAAREAAEQLGAEVGAAAAALGQVRLSQHGLRLEALDSSTPDALRAAAAASAAYASASSGGGNGGPFARVVNGMSHAGEAPPSQPRPVPSPLRPSVPPLRGSSPGAAGSSPASEGFFAGGAWRPHGLARSTGSGAFEFEDSASACGGSPTSIAAAAAAAAAGAGGSGSGGPRRRCPFVIGVAGGTASGKTTVCDRIIQRLHEQCVVMINQDSFYRNLTDVSELVGVGRGGFWVTWVVGWGGVAWVWEGDRLASKLAATGFLNTSTPIAYGNPPPAGGPGPAAGLQL